MLGLAALTLIVAGCAGNGDNGSSNNGNGTTAQFTGQWSGGCADTDGETQSELWAIDTNGNITGSEHNNTTGDNGTFTGTVDGNGNVTVTYTEGGDTFTATGRIVVSGKSLRGTDSYTLKGLAHTETFYLNLNPAKK